MDISNYLDSFGFLALIVAYNQIFLNWSYSNLSGKDTITTLKFYLNSCLSLEKVSNQSFSYRLNRQWLNGCLRSWHLPISRCTCCDGNTRNGRLVLALDGRWIILLFSFTNRKFKVSLHVVNCCCDVDFLNTCWLRQLVTWLNTIAVQVHQQWCTHLLIHRMLFCLYHRYFCVLRQ